MFWRLYYDKRISAAHAITETFEATFAPALNLCRDGFDIDPAPAIKTPLPASSDGYDLLAVARIMSGPAEGAIHPIGLMRTLARSLSAGAGFAGYDDPAYAGARMSGGVHSPRCNVPDVSLG